MVQFTRYSNAEKQVDLRITLQASEEAGYTEIEFRVEIEEEEAHTQNTRKQLTVHKKMNRKVGEAPWAPRNLHVVGGEKASGQTVRIAKKE